MMGVTRLKYKVVVSDHDYPDLEVEKSILEPIGAEVIGAQCKSGGKALLKHVKDADGILQQYAEIGEEVIKELDNCKVIARYGTGVDILDVKACHKYGITVTNVPYYCVDEVADHAITLALTLIRRIPMYVESVRNGKWHWSNSGLPIHDFSALTYGVIGFGKIGRNMLKKANALKFNTIAYDPYVDAFFMEEMGVKKVEFDEIVRESDVLSIQVPLNNETFHIIGEKELQSMKKTAVLINTSRGPQVDNEALAKALEEGCIAAAALDDIEDEPAKKEHWNYRKNPLLKLENCLITPHSAYYSEESLLKARSTAAEEVKRVLTGEGARYIV